MSTPGYLLYTQGNAASMAGKVRAGADYYPFVTGLMRVTAVLFSPLAHFCRGETSRRENGAEARAGRD